MYIEQMEQIKRFTIDALANALEGVFDREKSIENYSIRLRDQYNLVGKNVKFQFLFDEYFMKIYLYYKIDQSIVDLFPDVYIKMNSYLLNSFSVHFRGSIEILGPGNDALFIDPRQYKGVTQSKEILKPTVYTYWQMLDGHYYFIEDANNIFHLQGGDPTFIYSSQYTRWYNRCKMINEEYDFSDNITHVPEAWEKYKQAFKEIFNQELHLPDDDHIYRYIAEIIVEEKKKEYPWESTE